MKAGKDIMDIMDIIIIKIKGVISIVIPLMYYQKSMKYWIIQQRRKKNYMEKKLES